MCIIVVSKLLGIYGGSLIIALLSPVAARSGYKLDTSVGRESEVMAIIHGRSLRTWARASLSLSRTISIYALPPGCKTSLMERADHATWCVIILRPMEASVAVTELIAPAGLDQCAFLKFTITR